MSVDSKRLLGLLTAIAVLLLPALAFAAGTPEAAAGAGASAWDVKQYCALAAGLGIGIAAFGGALGQGRASAAALSGFARNPQASGKIFVPMILGLALIESLVIYAFVVALMLFGKIGSI